MPNFPARRAFFFARFGGAGLGYDAGHFTQLELLL
jgi:hypothetical protein